MTMRIDTRHIAVFGKARINHPQNHHPFVALLALFHIIPVLEQHAAFWQEYYWTLMFQLQAVFQQFSTVHCVDSLTADTDCDSGMCDNVQADLAGSPLNISQPSPHPAKQMDYSKTYGSHQISTSVLCTFLKRSMIQRSALTSDDTTSDFLIFLVALGKAKLHPFKQISHSLKLGDFQSMSYDGPGSLRRDAKICAKWHRGAKQ